MVADGAHLLLSLSLVLVLFRARRAEPYLVAVLAAAIPDSDKFVFDPLVRMGYLDGILWTHRGLTHSLLFGILLVLALSAIGPWRAAAVGFGSHILFDFLSGGVRLFAPIDTELYGLEFDWLLLNIVTMLFSVTVILGGLLFLHRRAVVRRVQRRVDALRPDRLQR
ncbi:metal-dependent hydrolase [Halolamina sp. CBA1230]|uniref:metal-dependent hydrolase n=1 Tax=Halolamina sp. CBA1230 TaxID=1853690 RepID=UPI0009A190B6|nr:metal-dependent hydrolase [Halolamina sp. CBA1230]QKY20279.1 metal-dependent hydrolase [Halolamina sp. CBA1230]